MKALIFPWYIDINLNFTMLKFKLSGECLN